ncbi:MAG: mycothiol-dependent nitroreductase Rv2466c family protein [Marmoricola sp.]
MTADLDFYFDPVCPFAWMTSTWVRMVAEQRDYTVEWRFISLRHINAHLDYATHFPVGYEAGHTAGLRLLRVAARTRADLGPAAVGTLYAALGTAIFEREPVPFHPETGPDLRGTADFVRPVLAEAGLPADLAEALEDPSWDDVIRRESDQALALTGKDVGTPIIHVEPPHGVAFFGPVISRRPSPEQAVELWEHVLGLARFGGFAELKRSLREVPQLRGLGVAPDETGTVEDWHGGSRRQKR